MGGVMGRVLGLHEVELRPDVDPSEFERVFADEIATSATPPGFRARLLKGERGDRTGKFLVLMEMDDVETFHQYFPEPDVVSEQLGQFMQQHPDTAAAWDKMSSFTVEPDTVTDYVVVVE